MQRRECAFCAEPRRWPDRCAAQLDPFCAEVIAVRCGLGDHRRCTGPMCPVAARWFDQVRQAGQEAARAAGATWAVVSILGDRVSVIGTGDHLGRVKSLIRSRAVRAAGIDPNTPEGKGWVYIVSADGGDLF